MSLIFRCPVYWLSGGCFSWAPIMIAEKSDNRVPTGPTGKHSEQGSRPNFCTRHLAFVFVRYFIGYNSYSWPLRVTFDHCR